MVIAMTIAVSDQKQSDWSFEPEFVCVFSQ